MIDFYIKTEKDAMACIGSRVYWDDVSSRYVMLRSGILESVNGKNLVIDGNDKYLSNLPGLRNFEHGGRWARP